MLSTKKWVSQQLREHLGLTPATIEATKARVVVKPIAVVQVKPKPARRRRS